MLSGSCGASARYRNVTVPSSSLRRFTTRSRCSHRASCSIGIFPCQTLASICFTSPSVVSCAMILPAFITAFSAAMYSTSETICVEMRTIRSCANSDSRLRKRTRSPGSSPAVGSSRIKISGSLSSACAMPTRRFIPPESFTIFLRRTSVRLTRSSSASICRAASVRGRPLSAAIYSR